MTELEEKMRARKVARVLGIVLFFNLIVAAAKILYGSFSGLISLQADGYHSTFDAVSNIVGLVMTAFARKPPDKEHPYGHQKLEALASLFIGVLVVLGMLEIGRSIYDSLALSLQPKVEAGAFIVLISTVFVNLSISLYERKEGEKLNSLVLKADASHTLSDSFSAVAVLIGVLFVHFGFHYADIVAACIVLIFIGFAAFRVLHDSVSVMVDTAYLDASSIKELVDSIPEVRDCHYIRSRGLPGNIQLEFHLALDKDLTLDAAGKIMDRAKYLIRDRHPEVYDILIQLEPDEIHYTDDVPENLI